ncbi:TetR/AcrR family transcriptional regulator [Acetobacter cerevisiae]|uniref:Transcriptional regulator n=1 Tax=Acetobacter cerevisiae TaxID=178900 RepID=A0A149QXM0_9PROT|nr:TetR/AcrR family transcriptional regulator [Acetobacter cerevisiae]KXV02056.1 transcriptional regulator [Acetobacter cerevisiae]GBQ08214.1 transcriptional regulator [Acetobacter cerevisiae DSM 14362]
MSSHSRAPLTPRRANGRQRVAELLQAAASVIQERGFEAATMAEIAAKADAKIGSLYRFFPNKEAVADALMQNYSELLEAEYQGVIAQAAAMSVDELADALMDLLVRTYSHAQAVIALLDSRTDWTDIRLRFREQAVEGVLAALQMNAPHLGEAEGRDIATVVLNNMKTIVAVTFGNAPTTRNAPDELKLMNRLYLNNRLRLDG